MGKAHSIAGKRVGIVGCTFPGTLIFIEKLCLYSQEQFGSYNYPGIILEMRSLSDFIPKDSGNSSDWVALLLESVHFLRNSSCDIIVSPANSTQSALRRATEGCSGPRLIDIVGPVRHAVISREYRKALLLATDATLNSQLYHEQLQAAGVEIMTPTSRAQKELNDSIVQRLVCGAHTSEDRDLAIHLISEARSTGAECVILGCTELCLLVGDENSALPVIDSNSLLAKAVIDSLV